MSSSPSTIDKTRHKFLKVLLYVYGIELSELVLGEPLLVPLNGVIRLASSYGTVKMKVHQDLITQKSPSAGAPPPPYRSAPPLPIGYRLFSVRVYEITFITEVLTVKLNKVSARKCRE